MSQLSRFFTTSGPGSFVQTLTGNSGGAISPTGGNINIVGTVNQITTVGAGSTITISIPSSPSFGGTTTVATGLTATTGAITASSGNVVITAGNLTLPNTTNTPTGEIQFGGNRFISNFGSTNTFVGFNSGNTVTSGTGRNNGFGSTALNAVTTSAQNNAFGQGALNSLTTGSGQNSAFGEASGFALLTGSNNTFLGYICGFNYTGAESSNILIGSGVSGTVGESNVLRIGAATGTTASLINSTFISGITGIVITGAGVIVNASNQLGVLASSRRFKNDIKDMADDSNPILKLRPVTFTWNKESSSGLKDATSERQFGFIAEEAAEVIPTLVNYDAEGKPFSFKYNEMSAILLNELQKALKRIEVLETKLGVNNGSTK